MEFKDFILNEKVSDLPKELQDRYWKIIHLFNSWKKSKDPKKQNILQNQMSDFKDVLKQHNVLDPKSMASWDEKMAMVFGKLDVPEIKSRKNKPNTDNTKSEIKKDEPEKELEQNQENNTESEQNDSDFDRIEIDQDFVEKAFDKFNTKYFNGVLNKIPIKIIPANLKLNHGTIAAGAFSYSINASAFKIEPQMIQLDANQCNISFSSFRNTFVHEMLHYYVMCYLPLDPDPESNENLWKRAIQYYAWGKKQKCFSILEITDNYSHGKRWLKLARELNSKYKELTVVRNVFVNSIGGTRDNNQLELINKLKDCSMIKLTIEHKYASFNFVKYKLFNNSYLDIYKEFINHNPLTSTDFLKYNKEYSAGELFGMGFDGIKDIKVEIAPIIKPQAAIEFRCGNLTPSWSGLNCDKNDKMIKQMKDSNIFGSFKKLGTIIMKHDNNESLSIKSLAGLNENTDIEKYDSFSNWINNNIITEKTIIKGKKHTLAELLDLGFSEDEADAIINGEFDFDSSTI